MSKFLIHSDPISIRRRIPTISETLWSIRLRCSPSSGLPSFLLTSTTNYVRSSRIHRYLEFVFRWILYLTASVLAIANLHLFFSEFGVLDMRAFDQLRKLEMFFEEETRRGCSIIDLYELVQHAGNILPRLWVRVLRNPFFFFLYYFFIIHGLW